MNGEATSLPPPTLRLIKSSGHLFVYSDGTTAMVHYCREHQSPYGVARLPTQSNESIISSRLMRSV
jgi:hypothetical protein